MKFIIPTINLGKDGFLVVAELMDAFRIVPRIVLACYGWFVYEVVSWFMLIAEPTTQHASLVSTVVGLCAILIGFYNNSGRKWG